MQSIIFLLCLVYAKALEIQNKFCDVLSTDINKRCYIKETLAKISHCPNQMAVDTNTNTLYFSVDTGHNTYSPAFLRIDNKKMGVLKGIKDAFAIASDNENFNVYFGGNHGIYRFNTMFKTMKRLLVPNLDIWWLFAKKNLYFIKFPSLKGYKYYNKTIEPVRELTNTSVHQFVLDANENIFFINSTGLYGIIKDGESATLLKDNTPFVGMVTDNNQTVFACSEDGIFVISNIRPKVMRVVSIPGVTGITFDKENNLIYSDSQEISRLLPVS